MRFFDSGPNIPADLIEQRNLGNVIFFCGAGISRKAGLPDFGGLTTALIEKLGAEKAQKTLDANESFDRVFNALIREFGSPEIDRQIYEALRTPRRPKLDRHRVIVDLSRNSVGGPQIVTTNFDLLFEKVDPTIRIFVPPALPDLSLDEPLEGLVYLHGRLAKPEIRTKAGYIISSADFGRAYLAEGWAARFVKALRERFTIVLLGYSANDPPMRYLLEGLHARQHGNYGSPIYAFTPGTSGEVEEDWQDRGVTPITYDPAGDDHSGLWDTLSAWANAAAAPDAWNEKVIALAGRKPSTLKPCERGQVANLISTKVGARLFADATPTPPAEWLCVFDPYVRYAKPRRRSFEDGSEIDPLDFFALDDDPSRPEPSPNHQVAIPGVDFLMWAYGDTTFPERTRLAGWNATWSNQLPERLHHIARWVGEIAHEPAAVWWASGFVFLHPTLMWFIGRNLNDRSSQFPTQARKFWQLYLEAQRERPADDHDFRWFEFQELLKRDGWSSFAIRQFERANQPHAELSRYAYGAPLPPSEDWPDLDLRQVVDMKIRVLDRHGSDQVPDDRLREVVEIIRRSLIRTSELMNEIDTIGWHAPTLHPTGEPGETFHGKKELYFLWFKDLFLRLVALDPQAAKAEVAHWNQGDPQFFGKLVIFASMYPAIASPREACDVLRRITSDIFWDAYSQRELLFTFRARWPDFSPRQRRVLEKKIIAGPPQWEDEKRTRYRVRKAAYAASILRWLELNGCELTGITSSLLPKLQAADPRWNDQWAQSADDSLGPRGGTVARDKSLQGLELSPINEIVAAAIEKTKDEHRELKDYRPFEGLVAAFPYRALSALRRAARNADYPIGLWKSLLSEWPEDTPARLLWLLAWTLARLPAEVALELRNYLPEWVRRNLKAMAALHRASSLAIFDMVVAPYTGAGAQETKSGIGTTTIGGIEQDRSEVSFDKAINSPGGKLAEGLLSLLRKPSKSKPFPKYLAERLQKLFSLPGDGGGHTVCIATQQMGLLDYYYGDWTRTALVPLFELNNPRSEAAWHGLAHDQNGLSRATLVALNDSFLRLLSGQATWKLNESEHHRHAQRLVSLARPEGTDPPIVSFAEARSVLAAIDDGGRADALTALSYALSGKEGSWPQFVKPFIENAWPRQVRYRSEATSRAFARLLESAGDFFPDAVQTVLPFLRPVPHLHMITYRLVKESKTDEHDLGRKFPSATLAVLDALIGDDRSTIPYELANILDILAETQPSLRQSRAWLRLKDLAG